MQTYMVIMEFDEKAVRVGHAYIEGITFFLGAVDAQDGFRRERFMGRKEHEQALAKKLLWVPPSWNWLGRLAMAREDVERCIRVGLGAGPCAVESPVGVEESVEVEPFAGNGDCIQCHGVIVPCQCRAA